MRSYPKWSSLALALLLWLLVGTAFLLLTQLSFRSAQAQDPLPPGEFVPLTQAGAAPALICPSAEFYQNEELKKEDEPNNKLKAAMEFTPTEVYRGQIHKPNDQDWYKFNATAGQRFSAATSTLASEACGKDSKVELYNNGGVLLASNDDSGRLNGETASSIAGFPIPASGTYHVRVTGDGIITIKPYQLYTNLYGGTPPAEVEPNGSTASAQQLPTSKTVAGTLANASDHDYFKTTLNAGDTVFVSLDMDPNRTGAVWNGRVGVGLFDNLIILSDDDNAETPRSEAMIFTVRDAGQYYVFVSPSANPPAPPAGTPYHLSVNVYPGNNGLNCTNWLTTDAPQAIGPNPGVIMSTILVTEEKKVADLNLKYYVNHGLPSDLQIGLQAPNGSAIPLVSNLGTSLAQNLQSEFDDEAAVPPIGVYQHVTYQPYPPNRLAAFDGLAGTGVWTTFITDTVPTNGGTLFDFRLELCTTKKPAKPAFESPDPGDEFDKTKIKFDWEPANRAAWYKLHVRQDDVSGPLVVNKDLIADTKVKVNLEEGHDYYARLYACNPQGCKKGVYLPIIVK